MQLFHILLLLIPVVYSKEHFIYWNTSSVSFVTSNDPEINVRLGDKIRIICPNDSAAEGTKHLVVNQVSELSYMSCTLETQRNQVLLCNSRVRREGLVNIVNRPTVFPGSFTFEPGNTYYWISTSTGYESKINNGINGLCVSDNMRLRINVLDALPPKTTTQAPVVNVRMHPKARVIAGTIPDSLDHNYVLEVAQLANEGRTGTFPREENLRSKDIRLPEDIFPSPIRNTAMDSKSKGVSGYAWDPVPVETYTELLNDASNLIYDSLKQPEDIQFVVHEDESGTLHAKSYPLESSASTFSLCCTVLSLILLF